MAESKGALFTKTVQKHAGRAKEKLLQNLGKVDRTLDDIFEEHLQNFNRQHQQATRLQKEFNNYIRCIRAVQTASKSLMEAITEAYESGWSGHDLLYVQAQNMEMLWQDFSHKLGDQVLIPLNTYTNQFPEVRKKVEKRGRKLVDYDSQRHSFQNLQANAAKRRDDVKVTKGREQLEEAKRTYEVLNSELHDELPALYDSRVLFYVNNLQTLFSAEQLFHSESSKVFGELEAITDKLAMDCQRGSYTKRAITNNISPSSSPINAHAHNGNTPTGTVQSGDRQLRRRPIADAEDLTQLPQDRSRTTHETAGANAARSVDARGTLPARRGRHSLIRRYSRRKPVTRQPWDTADAGWPSVTTSGSYTPPSPSPSPVPALNGSSTPPPAPARASQLAPEDKPKPTAEDELTNNNGEEKSEKKVEELYDIPVGSPVAPEKSNNNTQEKQEKQIDVEKEQHKEKENENQNKNEDVYDIPVGATLAGLPPGTLYRVRATYRYTREDSDELSFDVGDTIRVVEYEDPDEQEEGWLMGIKETTNEKGMFPANFTRPI